MATTKWRWVPGARGAATVALVLGWAAWIASAIPVWWLPSLRDFAVMMTAALAIVSSVLVPWTRRVIPEIVASLLLWGGLAVYAYDHETTLGHYGLWAAVLGALATAWMAIAAGVRGIRPLLKSHRARMDEQLDEAVRNLRNSFSGIIFSADQLAARMDEMIRSMPPERFGAILAANNDLRAEAARALRDGDRAPITVAMDPGYAYVLSVFAALGAAAAAERGVARAEASVRGDEP